MNPNVEIEFALRGCAKDSFEFPENTSALDLPAQGEGARGPDQGLRDAHTFRFEPISNHKARACPVADHAGKPIRALIASSMRRPNHDTFHAATGWPKMKAAQPLYFFLDDRSCKIAAQKKKTSQQ